MLGHPHRRGHREERGAAALEFALVAPIFVLVVLGIANFGFLLTQQISLSNVAREAARNAVVDGPDCAAVKTMARTGAATIGMEATAIPTPTVTPCPAGPAKPCTGSTPGAQVTVTVTKAATWVVPFAPLFTTSTAPNLESKGVMRCEFS